MAFYQDMDRKSRGEKKQKAEARGGFEDEGSRYQGNRGGAPRQGRPQGGGYGAPQGAGRTGGQAGYGAGRANGQAGHGEGRFESRTGRSDAPRQGRPQGGGYGAPQGRGRTGGQGGYGEGRFENRDNRTNRSDAPCQSRPQGERYGAPQGSGFGAPQGRGRTGGQGGYGEGRFENRDNRTNRSDAPRQGRPQGGGFGAPQSRGRTSGQGGYGEGRFDNRPRFEQDSRPISFRDRPHSAPPRGERPEADRGAPRDFKKSGNYRFSKGEPSRYDERGAGVTPPSYDEQRRQRAPEEPRYAGSRYNGPAAYDVNADSVEPDFVPNENLLSGRNPIREALKSGRDIEKLLVARGELSGSAREIVAMAKERHIPVQEVDRVRLDDITHNHQGMLAFASAYQYSSLEAMLALAEERGEQPFLVLLDGITDPHNLGAVIRTAECAGAHGVIVQERRAVGLTPAAVKASAGAVEHIPVARVTNLANTIESLKEKNIWVYAADMEGEDYSSVKFDGAVALVIGAEGEGVGRRVAECCDKTVSIPLKGKLDSLNASVAAGILMYAVVHARG